MPAKPPIRRAVRAWESEAHARQASTPAEYLIISINRILTEWEGWCLLRPGGIRHSHADPAL